MPFQPINFRLNQSSPLSDLAQGLMQGMQFRNVIQNQKLRGDLLKSELEQAPELAKSRKLINSLREMQLGQAQREADPQKKMDWINQFAEILGKGTPEAQAYTRSQLGIPQVTAAEDLANKLRLLEKKSELATKKSGMDATQKTISEAQQDVENINKLLPELDAFIALDEPRQIAINPYAYGDAQAIYEGSLSGLVDSLVMAKKFPRTKAGIETARNILRRYPLESHGSYKKKLKDVRRELVERRDKSLNLLQGKGLSKTQEDEKIPMYNPKTDEFE